MSRRYKSVTVAWSGVAGLLLCPSAFAQPPAPLSLEQAEVLLAKAWPHLEAVMNLKRERPPRVRLATEADGATWEKAALELQLHLQFPDLTGDSLLRTLRATQDLFHSAAAARYGEDGETIIVLPENLPAIARWHDSLAPVNSPAFLQLALVREAARLVLDRRYQLGGQRPACRDDDRLQAFEAAWEGRALWVTRQVARRLGTEAFFPLLRQLALHAPDPSPDPGLRSASQQALRRRHWAAAQGCAFFDHLEAAGLGDVEKVAFTRPPAHADWIDHPERYVRALRANRPDPQVLLARLDQALPPGDWSPSRQPWTAAMVRQVASAFGETDRAEPIVRFWEEGRLAVWTSATNPEHALAVGLIRFATPAAAKAYLGFHADLKRKQDEKLGAGGGFPRLLSPQTKPVQVAGSDEAVWSDKRLQLTAASPPFPVTTLLVRAGTCVVEFTWHGMPADVAWAERALELLAKGS